MNKRRRFIITSLILSLGLLIIQFLPEQLRIVSIASLSFASLVLFGWSLREGLGRNMTLISLVLPAFFTVGVGFFWFLLPASIFTRVPIAIFYGLGIYALCLTSNIYTVSAIRTIALLRAARGVGFVLSLVTSFLIYDTILSFRSPIWITGSTVFITSIPMFLQGYWIIKLEKNLSIELLKYSLLSSLVMGELAITLFFWPVTVIVGSLFYTITVYVLLGLGQARLEERLFPQIVREYLLLGISVFIGMFIATRWGG